MSSALSTAAVYTDLQGLASLRKQAREESPAALKAVARQFEAIFMQMMLKSMRDASPEKGLFDSDQGKFYQEMFDKQMALSLSSRQGVGLADVLVRQLSSQASPAATVDKSLPVGGGQSSDHAPFVSPEDFVRRLKGPAQEAATQAGIPAEALLAQAALESGWGRHTPQLPDGGSSHNLFGIKADARWQGPRVATTTIEYRQGVAVKAQASFRAYPSFAESFADYAHFLQQSPRYATALQQGDRPDAYLQALQQAGYATDPAYADKISAIMAGPVMQNVL